ncbi:MAG: GNAT family N-acetyltransferase [Lentisphaerae bacterium]|nr:GNAT family N-acetyltransferase [Lentisphaerota bacterium]
MEVTSELAIRGTYCDLALRVGDKVEYLIEAKAIGIDLKDAHMKQACDYGANHGVQWVALTNGIVWRIYRIRFEQPINFDLVCTFDFLSLNPRDEKDQELLFLIAKEGLDKKAREDYYEKVQSVNRYVIGNLILAEPVLAVLRRELKRLADGMKIDVEDVEKIVKAEVLKREIVEGDEADSARTRVAKFYRKGAVPRTAKKVDEPAATLPPLRIETAHVSSAGEATALDELLWTVLWKPLGLPRDCRRTFAFAPVGVESALIARVGERIVGGLVSVQRGTSYIFISHLAIEPQFQGRGIGQALVRRMEDMARERPVDRLRTIARNTSVGFFMPRPRHHLRPSAQSAVPRLPSPAYPLV